MGKLDKKKVKHVAKLANLKLTTPEVNKFSKQLSDIVSFIEELNEVDTKGINPTSQTTGTRNALRKDKKTPGITQKEALSGTEKVHNGFFVVERLINK